jgi:subtilisin family serine protease
MDCTFLIGYDHQQTEAQAALDVFRNWKTVVRAEPNRFVRAQAAPPAVAPTLPWLDAIGIRDAWAITRGQPSVSVAIIDSGIDLAHREFSAGNLRVDPGCDVVDCVDVDPPFGQWEGDAAGRDDNPSDEFGHGTYISSLVAGQSRGGAPGCTILPVRALATVFAPTTGEREAFGKADDLARAIRFAVDRGARVLNLSYGNVAADRAPGNSIERDAVQDAMDHGCFLAAAMGNSGDEGPTMFPAAYQGVCGVAAIDNDGDRWPKSQKGTHCDLSAPGVSIEGAAMGGTFEVRSGTSCATAIVSAAAALVISACQQQGRTPPSGVQLGKLLTGTARKLWDTPAPRTNEFGFGCVDPAAAIQAALG